MLRVGLTGELGSGKSTVARMLAEHGARVFSSDDIGRALMQPGEAVYTAIVERFGPTVLLTDGQLNRTELARLAFDQTVPRVEELNAIVHPAVLAEQERLVEVIARRDPKAIVVIESALIFSTKHTGESQPWRKRFDRIVLVTAPDALKFERFLQRTAGAGDNAEARDRRKRDAEARLAAQRVAPAPDTDLLLLQNDGSREELQAKVHRLWLALSTEASTAHQA